MTNPTQQPRLVVGVGASAGGLDAFKQLLSALPGDTGMAFLLVQHLDPNHKSLLAELLAVCTEMTVTDADQGVELRPNTVYIIRPDTALAVQDGRIELSMPTLHRGVRLPVDHLFRSLARDYGARATGIVLSGAGSDGSAGLRDIKGAGGLTIAQCPESSGQPGMPRSAIDTGLVDLVLEIPEMPAALERFANLPPGAMTELPSDERDGERGERLKCLDKQEIGRLAALLEAHARFDLRVYKSGTIERRVLRRMALSGHEEIDAYLEHLRESQIEQQTLVRDMLIGVTEFFRDPGAYRALREGVLDPLARQVRTGRTLRVWVPACSTGEEAYSIGMELLDALDAVGKRATVQIFATDIDHESLAFARAAVYPPSISEHVSERRLKTYFKPLDGKGYQVRSPLRDLISFAVHDLTKDPPFSRMSLVSCRNVLIYLTGEAQRHVLKVLHFALEPDGCLFLSTSESVGPQRELFGTLSKSHRIYRKVGASRPIELSRARNRPTEEPDVEEVAANPPAPPQRPRGTDLARQTVLEAWVPPTVIAGEDGTVLFLHGELGPYLRFPQGEKPRLELSALLRPGLATRARGALYRCRRGEGPAEALSSLEEGQQERVRIIAKPAPALGDGAVMLTFEKLAEAQVQVRERVELPGQEAVIDELERELQATREDLRTTVEELETSNEELRSSNEESMSMNEELQSANEELEATTEELRSLNEELTTVNAQLREKVEQLEQAHDDLSNFFASTKVATVFLDERLCIKRYTPSAGNLLGIDDADIGRCVSTIVRELLQDGLEAEASAALDQLSPQSRELHTQDGRWILRQVLPYRTESRRIEGVVITFSDVTELRTANAGLEAKSRRLELAWETARGGIYEHRVPFDESTYHSDQWARILGYRQEELPHYEGLRSWLVEEVVHPDDRERLEQSYAEFIEGRRERYQVEARMRHRGGHWVWVRTISKALDRDTDGRVRHVLGMMLDISDLKETEAAVRESEQRFREMTDGLPLIVWVHDTLGQQEYVNATFCEFFGVTPEEMKGGRWQMLLHPDDADAYNREFYACVEAHRPFHREARVKDRHGRWRWIESWGRPRLTADGKFQGFVGTSADITSRKEINLALQESEERFRTLADNIAQLAWMADSSGSIFWFNKRWYEYTGTSHEDVAGWGWRKLHHPDHVERVIEKLTACLESGEVWEDTFPLGGADGGYRWFLSRALPIRNAEGEVVRWFGTNTDVTEQRDAEQRLVQADQQKDQFLAMLGHELRNPLAALRSATELLNISTGTDPVLTHTRDVLDRQTTHMAKLLDGLLDVSRVMRGKIVLERTLVDLSQICREIADDLARRLDNETLEFSRDLPSEPVWIDGDRVRLTQVIDNLLSNAVKFSARGGSVALSLERDAKVAVLRVRDTGAGIAPEQLPYVFAAFWQSTQTIDRACGGLGLGLVLVKALVELHGGFVEARSDGAGLGAEFIARLPLANPPATAEVVETDAPTQALRILVIEDNEDAAQMLSEVLRAVGHETTEAYDGTRGIELAKAFAPDVILCDLGLPGGMSGFAVARALRADAATAGIALVAVSGYGRPSDKKQSEEAGFDAHLTKPARIQELADVLARLRPF